MPNVFAVYVAASEVGQRNLEAGLRNLVWGWRDSVLDRKDHRQIVSQIRPGDLLIMGTQGPNPRVAEGGWDTARLGRALFLRFTSSLHQGQTPVWPDEIDARAVLYPNRVAFEVLYEVRAPEVVTLEPAVLEALRWSANTQGSAVLVDLADDRAPQISIVEQDGPDDGQLDHTGEFDALAQVLVRREQRKLRARKFGDRTELTCAVCSKTYPARLVRAAHIKRRSACTPDELRDLNNVMPACALGCDEMFEHGFLAVDDTGQVVAHRPSTGDLASAVGDLAGRRCSAHDNASRGYFAWHLASHN
ncbi:hypothetical protein [Nocardioides sp.]|uniref:hypothetical protein n=1 Tax=Nocardioides sp. TaxID=35761 RepID=UPI002626D0E5|nr:hypothetical protein [Nocardioides sp.]